MTQPTVPSAAQQDQQVTHGLAILLGTGLAAAVTGAYAAQLLAPLGISAAAVKVAWALTQKEAGRLTSVTAVVGKQSGPAQQAIRAQAAVYRSAFLLNSARRIQTQLDGAQTRGKNPGQALKDALTAESRFARQHEMAQARRQLVAARVDAAAKKYATSTAGGGATSTPTAGPALLGWYAQNDGRTTAECRAANGRNFNPASPPLIGYPGAVHPYCRCKPGPAHAAGQLVDDIRTGAQEAA